MDTLRSPMRFGGVVSWVLRLLLLSLGNTCTTGPATARLKMPVFSVSSGLIETMDPQHFCRRPCCCWLLFGRVATKAWFSLSSTWNRNEYLPGTASTLVAWRL